MVFAAAVFLFSACSKADRDGVPQKSYTLTEIYQYTPDEFAGHVFNPENPIWAGQEPWMVSAMQALVRAKNTSLDEKMAREAAGAESGWGYRKFVLEYQSKDAQGKSITLSEVVALPVGIGRDHHPDKILLNSHYTLYADEERPSGPYADIMMAATSSDAVFICPDLEGYGASADRVHPYLAHEVAARQSIDGVLAALQLLEDQGIRLEEDYRLFNVGYSQGASNALAIHRYIENRCSRKEQERIRLEKSICCAGAYAPKETLLWYAQQEQALFPSAFPLIVEGMLRAHPSTMAGLSAEDFFTQEFIDAGIFDFIHKKTVGGLALHSFIHENVGWAITDILSEEVLTPGTKARTALEKALAEEDLTQGWKPVQPVQLYHATDDQYVPFLNATLAMLGLGTGNIRLSYIPPFAGSQAHLLTGLVYYSRLIIGELE